MVWIPGQPSPPTQVLTDVANMEGNFEHLEDEQARAHDFVVGTGYSGEHLGGSARALANAVGTGVAAGAVPAALPASEATEAAPSTTRRDLV